LALYREVGSRRGEALALHDLGEVSHFRGRNDEALGYLTEALGVAQDIGDRGNRPYFLATLASVHLDIRLPAGAADLAGAAVSAAEALDDPRAMAVALNARATIDHHLGHHAEAVRGHRRALELTGTTGDRYPEVDALIGLAAAAEALGAVDEARVRAERAHHLASEIGLEVLDARARTILDRLR
jgi:tetratricopeptide (TPR) repeat protein